MGQGPHFCAYRETKQSLRCVPARAYRGSGLSGCNYVKSTTRETGLGNTYMSYNGNPGARAPIYAWFSPSSALDNSGAPLSGTIMGFLPSMYTYGAFLSVLSDGRVMTR